MFHAILLLSGLAFAEDPPAEAEKPAAEDKAEEKAPAQFEDIDKDGSKTIEPAEAKQVASLDTGFATADADKDGKLSRSEFDAWSKAGEVH